MNQLFKEPIDRIFEQLGQIGSTLPCKRRAGLAPVEVQAAFDGLGLDVPDDLLNVYCYCDGTSTYEGDSLSEIQFFPGFYWMSLEDAIDVYRAISRADEWNRAWFPIFANGGGDFYAVVCDKVSPYYGEIVGFILAEEAQLVEFQNIVSMLRTIERSFAGSVFYASEGRLKADYPKMRAIARQLQPDFTEHET
ncbi:SMI1/KNR4 family protein [Herbaspirillum sp. RU 5E]|jgi:hypothetical protein|nr:SMI1/KNR4 family protein [Herbaspirillum sp. RU 5E]